MTTSSEILQALGPRDAIAQAVNILVTRHGVDSETALDMLVRSASKSRIRVREAAARLVAESRRR